MAEEIVKKKRGFAAMDPAKARELQSRGGSASAPSQRAFAKDRKLASRAGKLGAKSLHSSKSVVKETSDVGRVEEVRP